MTVPAPPPDPPVPPTRRAFVAMLGLGAALLAVVHRRRPHGQPHATGKGLASPEPAAVATRWIGHC